jgi:hypothetical protein
MSTDQNIEQEIQAKGADLAPRVTPADVEASIASEHYFTADEGVIGAFTNAQIAQGRGVFQDEIGTFKKELRLLTFCVLVLRNGFTVTGTSACASPENFDAEIGRKVARQDAVRQVWPLLGYLLKERLQADGPMNRSKIDRIARVAHEVNKAYCEALGDNSQPTWETAPEWQRSSARMGADLHMSGDFGPEASHISWVQQKMDEGWVYGEVKDPVAKTHPCIRPFAQLPPEQQAKDHIFRAVVHAMR